MFSSFLGSFICLIGSCSHFAYLRFMKFSVAPESTSAITSALFATEWTKNRSVIDFRAKRYTSPLLPCLISADLIRQFENPHLSPSLLPICPTLGESCSLVAVLPRPHCLVEWEQVGCRSTCRSHCS